MRRLLPDLHRVRANHPWIDCWFGRLMESEDMWHINRRSISLGLAIGLFCAFLPIPIQMICAAAAAIALRANFVTAIVSVWITNPFTITPIYYFCYRLGRFLLRQPASGEFQFEWSINWFTSGLLDIWQPFVLGCLTMSVVTSLSAYLLMRLYWRYAVIFQHRERRKRTTNSKSSASE